MNLAATLTSPLTFPRIFVTTALALGLTACGSSSSDNEDPANGGGNGNTNGNGGGMEIPGVNYRSSGDIDASLYAFPENSTTLSYAVYDIGFGESVQYDTYSEVWVRDGNQWTLDGDFWSATYTVGSDRITAEIIGMSIALPRFSNSGDVVMMDEYIEERVFGPFSNYTFSPGGDLPSRTIDDAVIAIEYDSEYDEVMVSVFARGVGMIAEMIFWDCPDNVTLSPQTDYTEICAPDYELELLVEE